MGHWKKSIEIHFAVSRRPMLKLREFFLKEHSFDFFLLAFSVKHMRTPSLKQIIFHHPGMQLASLNYWKLYNYFMINIRSVVAWLLEATLTYLLKINSTKYRKQRRIIVARQIVNIFVYSHFMQFCLRVMVHVQIRRLNCMATQGDWRTLQQVVTVFTVRNVDIVFDQGTWSQVKPDSATWTTVAVVRPTGIIQVYRRCDQDAVCRG